MLFEIVGIILAVGVLVALWPLARRVFRRDDDNDGRPQR